ncbi:MAG TPA: hypothetical protein VEI52_25760 [Terriglobales bacterium]|nr:hypothetical protein [Terriglobales bacterium]
MKDQHKLFLVRAGANGEDEDYVLENNLAIIGFREFDSLEGMQDYDSVVAEVRRKAPELKPRAAGNVAGQLWTFAMGMKEGDTVVLPRKLTSQVAFGKVTGPYEFRKIGDEFRHVRPVKWLRPDVPRTAFQQDLLFSFGAFLTVCNISRNDAERRVAAVLNGKPDPGPTMAADAGTKHSTVLNDSQSSTATPRQYRAAIATRRTPLDRRP